MIGLFYILHLSIYNKGVIANEDVGIYFLKSLKQGLHVNWLSKCQTSDETRKKLIKVLLEHRQVHFWSFLLRLKHDRHILQTLLMEGEGCVILLLLMKRQILLNISHRYGQSSCDKNQTRSPYETECYLLEHIYVFPVKTARLGRDLSWISISIFCSQQH